jgi:hypothetical protein
MGILAWPGMVEGDVVLSAGFSDSELVVSEFEGYDLFEIRGLPIIGDLDGPALPVQAVPFEMAAGERIEGIDIIDLEQERIPGTFSLAPARLYLMNRPADQSDGARGQDPVPASPVQIGSSGNLQGVRLGSVLVYPIQYIPGQGAVLLTREVTFRVRTTPSPEEPDPIRPQGFSGESWRSVMALGIAGEKGPVTGASSLDDGPEFRHLDETAEYVIVTPEEMAEEFQRLADWRTARGMPARVVTLEWIDANYPLRVDSQERIRSFLQDAYQHWGTRWVLLGGDSEIVPTRVCEFTENPFRTYERGLVVCDLYYACLDGSWDGDGDGVYGERFYSPGLDLYADVFLGRAPVNTADEAGVFVDKVLRYRKEPALDYQTRGLFMAQQIVPAACPGYHGEDIIEDCIRWLPEGFEIKRLYQCASSFINYPVDELNLYRAFQAMDEGYAVVGQVGHGDQYKMDCASGFFRRVHADSISNQDRLSFFALLNCSTNNIDVDCLGEHLVRSDRGGAIGFIGNTAYGFPSTGRQYMQYFFKLLYSCGVTTPGELATYFRAPYVPLIERSENNRWTQYSYLLLGDPAVDLWIDTPASLTVTHSGSMALGDSTYQVTVESGGGPAPGMMACLWMKDTDAYARGITGSDGTVLLPFLPGAPGQASLVVIAKGYLPVEETVTVTGSGRVRVADVVIDDESGGNGNGLFEAGETAAVAVTLKNDGESAVPGLEATLGLVPASGLDVDVEINGVPDPAKIWVGASGWQPGSVPFHIGAGEKKVLGPTPASLETRTGTCLWLDATGWHVRCNSGTDSLVISGTVTVDGGGLGAFPRMLEADDLLESAGGVVQFTCAMDTCDFEDGFNLQFADSVGISVVSGPQSLGQIAAGADDVAEFIVETDLSVPDQRPVWFVLDLETNGNMWSEWVRADLLRPHLEILYGRVDDAGGDGNGAPDPGETVTLYPAFVNWGGGQPEDIDLVMRAVSGASVSDSLVHLEMTGTTTVHEADEGFRFTVSSSPPVVEVELVADSRIVDRDTLTLAGVAAPESLWSVPGPGEIRIHCTPDTGVWTRGYRIVRRDPGKEDFELLDIVLQTGAYLDGNLAVGRSYEYAVSVFDSSGALSLLSDPITAWTNPPYATGFPARGYGESYGSPSAADLDRDGDMEIVVGTKDSRVAALHHDGTLVRGWPQFTADEVWGETALGDLDGDGDLEVAAGDRDGYLWAWNWDGSVVNTDNNPELDSDAPGWPRETAGEIRSAPTLADLDGDGLPEILVSSLANAVYCWRGDGSGYIDTTGVFRATASNVWASPAVGDLDGDGSPEVVVGTWLSGGDAQVYVWNADGTDFTGSSPFAEASGMIWTSAAIGNLDGDAELEFILGTDAGILYAWNHDGTGLLDGAGIFARLRDSHQKFRSSPALGDLDGDGDLEIVIGSDWANSLSDTVYAWHHDGTGAMPGGSRVVGTVDEAFEYAPSSAALADADGDGETDILICSEDGKVWAWDRGGSVLEGWPVQTRLACYASPGVEDLDGDGDIEVFIAGYDSRVHVWDSPGGAGDVEWGHFQQSSWNTGLYGFSPPADTTRPGIRISVLQNPVLERSLDLYLSSTEHLAGAPSFSVQFGAATPDTLPAVGLSPDIRDVHLFHAGLWAEESQTGTAQLAGWGEDIEGNRGDASYAFTFKEIAAAAGGTVDAADGNASLVLPPGVLIGDTHILVARVVDDATPGCKGWSRSDTAPADGGPRWILGPPGRTLAGEATVLLRIPAGYRLAPERTAVCRLQDGHWIPLPRTDAPAGWIGGRTERLGIFELRFMETIQEIIKTAVTGNYPNPFNPETTIRFQLSMGGRTVLTVHDVRGRRVTTLVDDDMPAGIHHVRWDGRNSQGRSVASGIYFCRLDVGGESSSAKLVLLK